MGCYTHLKTLWGDSYSSSIAEIHAMWWSFTGDWTAAIPAWRKKQEPITLLVSPAPNRLESSHLTEYGKRKCTYTVAITRETRLNCFTNPQLEILVTLQQKWNPFRYTVAFNLQRLRTTLLLYSIQVCLFVTTVAKHGCYIVDCLRITTKTQVAEFSHKMNVFL